MSSHHLSAGVARRKGSGRLAGKGLLVGHRWTLASSGSIAAAGCLLVRLLLAGAPAGESFGAAAIVGLALFLYCAIHFRVLDGTN